MLYNLSQPLQSYTNTILPYVTTIYHNPCKVILIQFSLMLQQPVTIKVMHNSPTNTILPYVTTIYHNPCKAILIQFSLMLLQSITTPAKLY